MKEKDPQTYCQKCRNRMNMAGHRVQKEDTQIKVLGDKVDYRRDVEALRLLEIHNPVLLERLRKVEAEADK